MFEPMERRIQRAFFDAESIGSELLDAQHHAVAVMALQRDGFQNQRI